MNIDLSSYDLKLNGALAYIARSHGSSIEINDEQTSIDLKEYVQGNFEHDTQIKNHFLSLGLSINSVFFSQADDLLNESMPLLLLTPSLQWLVCVGCIEGQLQLVTPDQETELVSLEPQALRQLAAYTLQPLTNVVDSIQLGHILKKGLKENKTFYAKYFFSSLFMALFALTIPVFSNLYYDKLVPSASYSSLFGVAAIVLVFIIFEFLLRSSKDIYQSIVSRREDISIDVSFLEALFYNGKKGGSMSSAFILWNEFQKIKPVLLNSLFQRAADIPIFLIFVIVIYINLGVLVVVPLLILALSLGMAYLNYRYTNVLMDRVKDNQSNRNVFITEVLYSIRMIHTMNNRSLMTSWVNSSNEQSFLSLQIRKANVFYQSGLAALSNLNQILLMLFAFFMVIRGEITTGAIISSVIVSGRMSGIISGMSSTLLTVFTSRKSINDLMKIFLPQTDQEPVVLQTVGSVEGNISLKGVSYQYDPQTPVVIDNLNLEIPAGQKVAIIGECGAGKSSLMSLLSGFCMPTQGVVMYDGFNTRHLAQNFYSQFISMVTNHDALFTGTVESNLQLKSGSDRQKVVAALQAARCGFVLQHPMGLRYPVSFMAKNLSSGQSQQLLLARSLSSDARVFLWDEPTSNLDEQTEQHIFDNLDQFIGGKTLLMVTHRRYLLKYFDRVLVVKNGKVIRDCAPDKLLAQNAPKAQVTVVPVK